MKTLILFILVLASTAVHADCVIEDYIKDGDNYKCEKVIEPSDISVLENELLMVKGNIQALEIQITELKGKEQKLQSMIDEFKKEK